MNYDTELQRNRICEEDIRLKDIKINELTEELNEIKQGLGGGKSKKMQSKRSLNNKKIKDVPTEEDLEENDAKDYKFEDQNDQDIDQENMENKEKIFKTEYNNNY